MRTLYIGACVLLLGAAANAFDDAKDKARPDKPQTPADQFSVLKKEAETTAQDFQKAFQQAKTQEERQKVVEKFRKTMAAFPTQALDLATKNSKDPVAVDALLWALENTQDQAEQTKALATLTRDHLQSDKIGPVCEVLAQSGNAEAEKALRTILEKNPSRVVQGQACFHLAKLLKDQSDELQQQKKPEGAKKAKEAEDLFDRVVEKYANVNAGEGSLGEAAKKELFEVRNLAIGKAAPEIEGQDSDGKKFKLSDYRGKVVVLDFWAKW